ncbi:MAG: D-glycero-beta-D-manno-heptose 1-phosphate adenylyltransferase, partial [Holophaga sp.]|nr:D-glycero-beta-D-manno-heptose 1-phosphate adenylyltransferase [Holophaga sp.]
GDTVIAMLAVGIAVGLPMVEAAKYANCAAGISVGKLGTSVVTPEEIIHAMDLTYRKSNSKIKSMDSITIIIEKAKQQKKRIVFTNGCFDILHLGHIIFLEKARNLGDILVLGLNSDASIRRLKGPKRPLIDIESRANVLAALESIDFVVTFEEDTPDELIKIIKPDVLVKGGDYTLDEIVGRSFVESYGGRVELIPLVDGKSTTNLIERVLNRYSEQ